MTEPLLHQREHHYGPVGRTLDRLSRAFAIGGALCLLAMALMSLCSVLGRALLSAPIPGDFELVQVMSAVAVVMFLPYCQMARGHVIVDFFSSGLQQRTHDHLDLIAHLLMSAGAFTFSWRMSLGLADLARNGDATMLLNLPVWYGYLPFVLSFFLLGCTALHAAWEDFTGVRR